MPATVVDGGSAAPALARPVAAAGHAGVRPHGQQVARLA
jgi:hypothetical protein